MHSDFPSFAAPHLACTSPRAGERSATRQPAEASARPFPRERIAGADEGAREAAMLARRLRACRRHPRRRRPKLTPPSGDVAATFDLFDPTGRLWPQRFRLRRGTCRSAPARVAARTTAPPSSRPPRGLHMWRCAIAPMPTQSGLAAGRGRVAGGAFGVDRLSAQTVRPGSRQRQSGCRAGPRRPHRDLRHRGAYGVPARWREARSAFGARRQ